MLQLKINKGVLTLSYVLHFVAVFGFLKEKPKNRFFPFALFPPMLKKTLRQPANANQTHKTENWLIKKNQKNRILFR